MIYNVYCNFYTTSKLKKNFGHILVSRSRRCQRRQKMDDFRIITLVQVNRNKKFLTQGL